MKVRVRKFLAFIGPYPYNPTLIFLVLTVAYFSKFTPAILNEPRGIARWSTAPVVFALAAFPSFVFALVAFLIQKYRKWSSSNLFYYILEIAFGQTFLFIFAPIIQKILKNRYHFSYQAPLIQTPGFFIGCLFLVLFSMIVMHRAERTIITRLAIADQLVTKLEQDREDLVGADEAVREQTSRFLHDRVQSDLMVVAMKLKTISGKSTEDINEVIERSIMRLENTRTTDLKNLVQILAPNFEVGGLKLAINTLALQYQSSMKVEVRVDDKSEHLSQKKLLAVFRIVEQSLINSLVHGPAQHVDISVNRNENGVTELVISDDGPGAVVEDILNGTGSAVIESWVGIIGGKKTVDTVPGHGYRLVVNFPA